MITVWASAARGPNERHHFPPTSSRPSSAGPSPLRHIRLQPLERVLPPPSCLSRPLCTTPSKSRMCDTDTARPHTVQRTSPSLHVHDPCTYQKHRHPLFYSSRAIRCTTTPITCPAHQSIESAVCTHSWFRSCAPYVQDGSRPPALIDAFPVSGFRLRRT
ncbi:hypothetical protein BD311DRAFT_768718, partial [Dichomitus squalens]